MDLNLSVNEGEKRKTFTCNDSNLVPRVLVPTERNRASGGRERERLERRLQLTAVDSYMLACVAGAWKYWAQE